MVIYLGCRLPDTSLRPTRACASRATRRARRAASPLLLGLAPDGVCRAALVSERAVGSYPTVSPLPAAGFPARWRSVLCGTFRRVTPPGRYPASCPSVLGLSSSLEVEPLRDATTRPAYDPKRALHPSISASDHNSRTAATCRFDVLPRATVGKVGGSIRRTRLS